MSFVTTLQQAANVLTGVSHVYQNAHSLASRGGQAIEDIRNLLNPPGGGPSSPLVAGKGNLPNEMIQDVTIVTSLAQQMVPHAVFSKVMSRRAKIQNGKASLTKAIAVADEYLAQMDDWIWWLRKCERTYRQANIPGFVGVGFNTFYGAWVPGAIAVWEGQRVYFGPPRPVSMAPPRFRGYRPLAGAPLAPPGAPPVTPSPPASSDADLF